MRRRPGFNPCFHNQVQPTAPPLGGGAAMMGFQPHVGLPGDESVSDEQNLPGATPETEPPSNAGVLWNALTRDPSAGVAVCDLDGMVLWVNERGLRMYVGPTATQGA